MTPTELGYWIMLNISEDAFLLGMALLYFITILGAWYQGFIDGENAPEEPFNRTARLRNAKSLAEYNYDKGFRDGFYAAPERTNIRNMEKK